MSKPQPTDGGRRNASGVDGGAGANRRSGDGNPSAGGAFAGNAPRVLGASLTFAAAMGVMTWLGHLADGALGTSPVLLIVGAAWAFAGGFYYLLRELAPDLFIARSASASAASDPRASDPGTSDSGTSYPGPSDSGASDPPGGAGSGASGSSGSGANASGDQPVDRS